MSESEPTDFKLEVEAARSAQQVTEKKDKHGKSDVNGLKPNLTTLADTENATATTSEDTGHEMDVDADADADADSEAETLIQSPAKKRNSVAEDSTVVHQVKIGGSRSSETGSIILTNASDKENMVRKRKRSSEQGPARSPDRISSHRSSPLSSPVAHNPSDGESEHSNGSDSDESGTRNNNQPQNDKIIMQRKRRRPPSEITASSSSHKRSKRNSVDNIERRETRSATYPRPSDDDNSPSPEISVRREHRRGASTQSTPHEFERRKRGRPPNIHTRRNRSVDRAGNSSDESEPRTSRSRPQIHKFASNEHDNMSPIKDVKTGPRKWKDKNGRTYLARACNNNDLEAARARLSERPEDLNMEDNAGNTPLQIAALEGFEGIVEFLLSKGAEVNARNVDKDTPLLDAVENGHVEVVRLLLKNGANPRLANAKGDEPYEMVHPDDENYAEIRELLAEAREKDSKKIAGVDATDFNIQDRASSRAASAASPRDSPPIGPRSPPAFGSRRRTGRSESTRNDLLWQANTQENLAKLASKGDSQGVASILSILEKAETEAVIAAAKAGHEEVLQLLIAMGKPNPDPDPVRGNKMVPGYNTPILAAIGRGHPDVVKLLANQANFNPTRRYRERTYYELSEERNGPRWEEEYNVLKQAYDKYAISKGRKPSSPRKTRDVDRSRPKTARRSSSVNSGRRQTSSPKSTYKTLPTKTTDGPSHRELRKTSDPVLAKRASIGNGETTEASTAVASDADLTVTIPKKGHRTRRSQSDLPPVPTLDHEPTQKRRRLVTGKEHRSRQTISTSSDHEDTDTVEVKLEEASNTALKRARNSSTPNPPEEIDGSRGATKKRRTMLESSPDDSRSRKALLEQKADSAMLAPQQLAVLPENPEVQSEAQVKSTEDDEMRDSVIDEERPGSSSHDASPPVADLDVKHESPAPVDNAPLADTALESTIVARESFDNKEMDDQRDDASEDPYSPPPAVEPPANAMNQEKEKEEEERRKQEEVEKLAAEQRAKEEAEHQAQLQAEQEAARKAEIEAQREAERLAEQERVAQEQAAEEARVKEEAEEKRKKEEQELAQRRREEEEQERQRQEMESRRRLEQLEQERKRLEALPVVLARTAQMIDENNAEVRSARWLGKYLPLYSVRTRQLDPSCEVSIAEDEWVPNFQVAGLLTTKDLNLSNYSSFSKKPVSDHQRQCLWRVARLKLSYSANSLTTVAISKATEIERIAEEKFMSMAELFWVKLSDFLDLVSQFSHLANLNLSRQAISLKSYEEILGARLKTSNPMGRHISLGLPNGVVPHTNGENGIS